MTTSLEDHAVMRMAGESLPYRNGFAWGNSEKNFIVENVSKMSDREIAVFLGRTIKAVKRIRSLCGVIREDSPGYKLIKHLKGFSGESGENHPNWKGGISKDYTHWSRLHRKRNPEKSVARGVSDYALSCGRLVKQPCETCNTTKNVQKHHEDYSKPLDVRWLCKPHHKKRHEEMMIECQQCNWVGKEAELTMPHSDSPPICPDCWHDDFLEEI